jgi:DNA-binding NarL/FixJ family response regulator
MRVLVADDNEVYRSLLSRFVSSQPDMKVVGLAADGDEAVRLASQLTPDVVLMDVSMPVLGGIEAARVLASTHREIKVVALTAHRSDDSRRRSAEAGACAFLCKSDVDVCLLDLVRGLRARDGAAETSEAQ